MDQSGNAWTAKLRRQLPLDFIGLAALRLTRIAANLDQSFKKASS